MPHDSQFGSVDEVFVPGSRHFHVRPEELHYYLGGKGYPRVDASETIGAPPSAAQRVERFQAGHRVHGVSDEKKKTHTHNNISRWRRGRSVNVFGRES